MTTAEEAAEPGDQKSALVELIEDEAGGTATDGAETWKVLVVDDDDDVHHATELAMRGLAVDGRQLEFLHARSAARALDLLEAHPDLAVLLLDVVMETPDAGLRLVRQVREELGRDALRIILRTGQPGYAPELESIRNWDINDYRTKSELNRTRLFTSLTSAIRSYRQIRSLQETQRGLEIVIRASTELGRLQGLQRFAEGLIIQLCALLDIRPEGLVCAHAPTPEDATPRVIAAAGRYASLMHRPLSDVPVAHVRDALQNCLAQRASSFEAPVTLYFASSTGRGLAAFVEPRAVGALERHLLELFCASMSVGFDNLLRQDPSVHAQDAPDAARPPAEDRYRNFFEAGLVGMAITVPDKHWGQFNQRLCQMLGYSESEMRALTWSELTHPDDLAADLVQFERLLAGQSDGYEMDKRFIRKDGRVLPAAIAVRCERDASGAPVRFYATVEDLSARKQAESALHENEQRLQALLDNISCGVIVHGPDSHIIDANPAACRVTGLTLDQMLGKVAIDPYWCFLEEDGSVMPLTRFPVPQVLARGGAVNKLVLGVQRPDLPRPVWVQVDAYPFRDGHGQISQVVVTFADITELKLAEDGARRLNRSLRVLSSGTISLAHVRDESEYLGQVCQAVVAAGGFLLSCVIFANRDPDKSAQIVARAGPAVEYLQAIPLSRDGSLPTGLGPFGTAIRTGRTQVNQDWRNNGAVAPWRDQALRHGFQSSIALPLTVANEVIGVLSLYAAEVGAFSPEEVPPLEELARNISVAIETLRTRQQRDLAEGANRAKGEFLANMSHEIRTPLNAIIGLNYLMRRENVTPEQAARLDKIEGASKHLLSLINDILDLSKIEAGQLRLESSNFHLSAVLDAVGSIIAESAHAKGLTVETDANAMPLWLRGDPTRLRQALLNLAGNAVKFTESGSITLRAKLLDDRGDELLVRFSVEDTGVGIAAEQIPRLFQAFAQSDASITRRFGGTGLGLVITKRLTALMDGDCGVDSRPGVGSTFWFTARLKRGHGTLPAEVVSSEAEAELLLRQRHRGERILVAEDNLVNQEVLVTLLCQVGLNVEVAANGQEAVALAKAGNHGMALMDMQMPVMGGLEATRAIRELPGWRTRPILALTANAFDEDRLACIAAGMDDFIVKPVDVNVLYETILKWLDGTARAGPLLDVAADGSRRPDDVPS